MVRLERLRANSLEKETDKRIVDMSHKKTSVVLTTYNGIRYLKEQLDSLKDQTVPFDEVIIMDDCSSDGTAAFVNNYIEDNNLSSWKLNRNKSNQGWKKNFKLGFDMVTGDYIYPCDQDDIWHLNKNERMLAEMELHPEVDVLVSNFIIFFSEYDNGSDSYKSTSKGMINDGTVHVLDLDPKWPYITRPGCVFCFRKKYFDEIKDRWDTKYPHDAILWRYARMKGTLAMLNESLIDFRRHGDNATTVKVRTRTQRIKDFDDYIFFHKEALKYPLSEKDRRIIIKGIAFLQKRKKMYETRNPLGVIQLTTRYYNYYLTLRGIAGDVFFMLKEKQEK